MSWVAFTLLCVAGIVRSIRIKGDILFSFIHISMCTVAICRTGSLYST